MRLVGAVLAGFNIVFWVMVCRFHGASPDAELIGAMLLTFWWLRAIDRESP